MKLYVDRFNRRDWDGVRELIGADTRLTVPDALAVKLAVQESASSPRIPGGSRANRLLTHPDGPAPSSELPTIRGAFGEYGIESDNRIFQKVEGRLGVAFDFDESRLRRIYEGGQSRYA